MSFLISVHSTQLKFGRRKKIPRHNGKNIFFFIPLTSFDFRLEHLTTLPSSLFENDRSCKRGGYGIFFSEMSYFTGSYHPRKQDAMAQRPFPIDSCSTRHARFERLVFYFGLESMFCARRRHDPEHRSRKNHIEIHFSAAKKAFP
jgi:hypothetical protein